MKNFFYKLVSFILSFFLLIYLWFYIELLGFGGLLIFLKKKRTNLLNISCISYVSRSIKLICFVFPCFKCLVRASVVKTIFSETESLKLIIGINKNEEKSFESHAWITFDNKIVLNNDLKVNSYKIIHTI